jgi:hypothetical protein
MFHGTGYPVKLLFGSAWQGNATLSEWRTVYNTSNIMEWKEDGVGRKYGG